MRILAAALLYLLLLASAYAQCIAPSYNTTFGVPKGYVASQAFEGRFNYAPTTSEPLPAFLSIDFTKDSQKYIWVVLDYAYEGNYAAGGNVEADFDVKANTARDWYHMLWMHPERSGREFAHGLTKEKGSDPEQLKRGLTKQFQTWAVGFYNSYGATTLAQVFQNPCDPNASLLCRRHLEGIDWDRYMDPVR